MQGIGLQSVKLDTIIEQFATCKKHWMNDIFILFHQCYRKYVAIILFRCFYYFLFFGLIWYTINVCIAIENGRKLYWEKLNQLPATRRRREKNQHTHSIIFIKIERARNRMLVIIIYKKQKKNVYIHKK